MRKHPGGRPPGTGYKPTANERELVIRMKAMGIPLKDMVLLLPSRTKKGGERGGRPISVPTLLKAYKHELESGKLAADMQVVNAFFRNCVGTATEPGSVAAQIWYTKTRMGWRETVNVSPGTPQEPQDAGNVIDGDEPNRLEQARRVAFALAMGAKLATKDA